MMYSQLDLISRELEKNESLREFNRSKKFFYNAAYSLLNRRHIFTFYVPQKLYSRAELICRKIEDEINKPFTLEKLSEILYTDFLKYADSNDMHTIYHLLNSRDLAPKNVYQSEEVYDGVIAEEIRGYEAVHVSIKHNDALEGEYLLEDLAETYEHNLKLENILEVVFCKFVDDYRKKLIKNPLEKVLHYLE
ncbi:hypothetical protein P9E76_19095 [Schinkia azotoformans]|nr:hypothetical protein [Schinkia azotoformans]MEC1639918.1 hypothetical protein [Schinkia azotoformans]MEC1722925.1 hypothetical protein [Schinkia azotoformans]MEC1947113.1 hypothetical protein [Schinkia azotoformans]MED4352866.1 hypothetical protein [Schinkia azotoformans]MED4414907.1 hypothetical protein [Schinkia azotoformans]